MAAVSHADNTSFATRMLKPLDSGGFAYQT